MMLTPYLAGIVLLIIVPAGVTFVYATFESDLVRPARFIGVDNFRELLDDEAFLRSLRNSALFAVVAVPLRLAGCLALSLLLHRRFVGATTGRTAASIPTVVPDVAYALVWLWLLNPLYGPINIFLDAAGLPAPQWLTSASGARAAIVLMSLFTIGEGLVVAMAVRSAIPTDLYELAALEGARPWTMFRRVTLPLMAPTLLLLLVRDTAYSFQVSFVPGLIVTEGGPPTDATLYLPLFVYRNGFEYLRYGYAAAATLVMFLVTAIVVFTQYRIARRWRRAFAT